MSSRSLPSAAVVLRRAATALLTSPTSIAASFPHPLPASQLLPGNDTGVLRPSGFPSQCLPAAGTFWFSTEPAARTPEAVESPAAQWKQTGKPLKNKNQWRRMKLKHMRMLEDAQERKRNVQRNLAERDAKRRERWLKGAALWATAAAVGAAQ